MNKLLVAFLVFIAPFLAYAQEPDKDAVGGFLHGQGWMCMIKAPDGWILDNQSWVDSGIYALFYPKGTSIDDVASLPPIIYFNSARLENATDEGLKAYVDEDIRLHEERSSATLKERKIEIGNFEKYYCLDLEYKNNGQQETIVYLRFLDGVHLVVLTTPAKAPHENFIPQLIEAISNMNFVQKAQNPPVEGSTD
ncbi:MAG: hypothetical protein CVV42_16515 [Candidatus Riflebacteria bacterium HGW-Riflebacteria-2]|jgi:hypothetical protein|nr:MAG: hypothetical protein CVV42_16515 [Candidatus Riflebacteria bacterium HGW-Riflebacteria-2]